MKLPTLSLRKLRSYLVSGCALIAIAALTTPALAVLTSDNTNIGAHPTYGTDYSAFWRTGYDYTILTNGIYTYINAPSPGEGAIIFRVHNTGTNNPVIAPDGSPSMAYIDSLSNLRVGSTVYGGSTSAFGIQGVYGASADNTGVYGISINGNGVKGVSTSVNGLVGISQSGSGISGSTQSLTNGVAGVTGFAPNGGLAFWGAGNITITGNTATKQAAGAWVGTSDIRTKKNIAMFNKGLSTLEQINPISYSYNGLGGTTDDGKSYVGVSGQDLQKVVPAMVSHKTAKLHATDAKDTEILQVDPSDFTYILINSVKELSAEVKDLQTQVRALKANQKH
jgi:hypothetical protein